MKWPASVLWQGKVGWFERGFVEADVDDIHNSAMINDSAKVRRQRNACPSLC